MLRPAANPESAEFLNSDLRSNKCARDRDNK
jgi:hypothetical protein